MNITLDQLWDDYLEAALTDLFSNQKATGEVAEDARRFVNQVLETLEDNGFRILDNTEDEVVGVRVRANWGDLEFYFETVLRVIHEMTPMTATVKRYRISCYEARWHPRYTYEIAPTNPRSLWNTFVA